ncbi:MAG: SIMPL domain-containing protein [Candidatus Buchananbacteria bacterium]
MENQGMCCTPEGMNKCRCAKHIILAILAIVLIVYVCFLTRNAWRTYDYIGKSPDMINQITVTGTAKVSATPDIAVLYLGVINEGATVNLAQKGVTDKMNAIIDSLKKEFKIDAKDIKTENYSVNPKYDWTDGKQRIIGYSANQSVTVKVRDFDKTGNILAKATELGANTVSGPTFSIDDPEKAKAEAREKAIAQAKAKAKLLADQVGIKLGRIVNFYEGGLETPNAVYSRDAMAMGAAEAKTVSAPTIEPGSQEIQLTVSISYEIK